MLAAIGTPMEWLPPSTSDTVGLLKEAIISAMASPASTSPPMVLSRIRSPSTSQLSSIAASSGKICSYFVVLEVPFRLSCPSTSPIMVMRWILCFLSFLSSVTWPVFSIRSSLCFSSSVFFPSFFSFVSAFFVFFDF